jgi:hypothetical protein
VPSQLLVEVSIASFLFSIGIKIAFTYTLKHVRNLILLFIFSIGIVTIMNGTAWLVRSRSVEYSYLLSSLTFAWNDEWITRMTPLVKFENLFIYANLSLFIVLLLTPIVLRLMRNPAILEVRLHAGNIAVRNWHPLAVIAHAIFVGLAIWIKQEYLNDVPFLFTFVISMSFGYMMGLWLRKVPDERRIKDQWLPAIQELGTLSLYFFIISMVLLSSMGVWIYWSSADVIMAGLKVLFITAIYVGLARRWANSCDRLVLISATWAFTLSAPVTCMNAMRSVVDRHGPAEDVLLLVPPVILWLVNYPHYIIMIQLFGR